MQDGVQRFIITNKWGAMPEVGYRGSTDNCLRVANGSAPNTQKILVPSDQPRPSSTLVVTPEKTEDPLSAHILAKQIKQEQIDEVLLPSSEGELENDKFNFELLPEHNVQEQQGSKYFQCNVCFSKYRHAFSLKRHFLRTHVSPIYISSSDISNCNINLSIQEEVARDEFQEQWRSSAVPIAMKGLYRCNTCADQFDELDELKNHVLNHPSTPSSKRFPCPQCPMTFSHKQNLSRHTSVHSGEKPYSCKYCGKGFPTATNQRRHERIHEGLKPYRCPHCASRFSQSGDLKKHIRKLHREFFHPCAYCLKYFDKETELKEHVHSHGKSLELNNRVLKKKLLSNAMNGDLETPGITNGHFQHKLLAAEFALHCGMCEKRFSTRTNLRRHQRLIHSHSIPIQNNGALVAQDVTESGQPQLQKILPSKYFASVSQNIAQNLQLHLDGKLNKSQQKSSQANDENSVEIVRFTGEKDISPVNVDWSNYNFPPDYTSEATKRSLVFKQELGLMTKPTRSNTNHVVGNELLAPSENGEDDVSVEVLDLSTTKGLTIVDGQRDKFGPVTFFICHACGERFFSLSDIEEHKVNNHPNVYCTHLEIEGTKNAPVEWFPYRCSPVGALRRCPVPPLTTASTATQLRCTKCQEAFQTNVALHEHILACGGHVDRSTAYFWKRRMPYTKVNRGMKRQRDTEPAKPMKMMVQKTKLRGESMMDFRFESETPPEPSKPVDAEENLKCDGCNRTFKYSSVLERHQKACLSNVAAIVRADALKIAQNQHSCLYCSRSFTYMASLKKHVADCSPAKFEAQKKLTFQKAARIASKKKMQLKKKRKKFPFYKRRQQPAWPEANCSSQKEQISEIKSETEPESPIVERPKSPERPVEPIPSPKPKRRAESVTSPIRKEKEQNLQKAKVKRVAITASKKEVQLRKKRKRFPFYKRRQQPALLVANRNNLKGQTAEIKSEMGPQSPPVSPEMTAEPISSPKAEPCVEAVPEKEAEETVPSSKTKPAAEFTPNPTVEISPVKPVQSPKTKPTAEAVASSKTKNVRPTSPKLKITAEPIAKSSKVKPTAESSKVKPMAESSKVKPTAESSKMKPMAESSKVKPMAESSKVKPTDESSKVKPTAESSKVKPTTEPVQSPPPAKTPKTKPHMSPAKCKSPKTKAPAKQLLNKCSTATTAEKTDPKEIPESVMPSPTKEPEAPLETPETAAKKAKKDVTVKVENDSSTTVRCELTQTYTCPKCKRTFTYLANFKKHLADLCPLRDQDKENTEAPVPAQVGQGEDEETEDDPPVPSKPTVVGKGASKTSPGISNKMNVSMWKHRLSNKMKTLEDSGSSSVVRTRTHDASAKNKAHESSKDGEKKWSVGWYRGRKRKAPLLRYHRRVPTAKNSLPSEAISDNDTDEEDSRCESEAEEASKSPKTAGTKSDKTDKLTCIGDSSSSIQREHISKYRKTILRKVKESTPSTSTVSKNLAEAYDADTDVDNDDE